MVGSGSFYDDGGVHWRYREHRDGEPHRSPNHVMEEPAVLDQVGDPAGLRVLDLGCGDGRFGRQLLHAGAVSYRGIDDSTRMVELAPENLAGTAGVVEHADLRDVVPPRASLDLVTARLSLHYVPDIDPVLATVAQALVPGGRFVFTVVHPVITSHDDRSTAPRTSWTVDDYFLTGPRRRDWMGSEVVWHHRTVEDHVRSVTDAGLTLTALQECAPRPERFGGHADELARRRRVPLFLLIAARV